MSNEDKFENNDKWLLHLTNLLKTRIKPDIFPSIESICLIPYKNKYFCVVECKKSGKDVWLEDKFFVRRGPRTDELIGRNASQYIIENF